MPYQRPGVRSAWYSPRYCQTCRPQRWRGPAHAQWTGGRKIRKDYVYLWIGAPGRYQAEHILVWEERFGPVPRGFHVHHINENKRDNRIQNLCLLTNSDHQLHHKRGVPLEQLASVQFA
jgi:hypothetical protein